MYIYIRARERGRYTLQRLQQPDLPGDMVFAFVTSDASVLLFPPPPAPALSLVFRRGRGGGGDDPITHGGECAAVLIYTFLTFLPEPRRRCEKNVNRKNIYDKRCATRVACDSRLYRDPRL